MSLWQRGGRSALFLALVAIGVTWFFRPTPQQSPNPGNPSATALAPPPPPQSGYRSLGFELLAGFRYQVDAGGRPSPESRIPDSVRALNGQPVLVSGFMVPLGLDPQGVDEFVLVKNQLLCCYGQVPKMNEWVMVNLDRRLPPIVERPIVVKGTLEVGEEYAKGQLLTIYRLKGSDIEAYP